MDRNRPGGEIPCWRALRRCSPGWNRPVSTDQQTGAWIRSEDQHLWWSVQDDGEHQQVSGFMIVNRDGGDVILTRFV